MTSVMSQRWREYAAALMEDGNSVPDDEASMIFNAARSIEAAADRHDTRVEARLRETYGDDSGNR